jgi:hypothetical protein
MSAVYDQEASYQEAMREAFAEIRDFAARNVSDRIEPELARAIWLAIPAVRFGKMVRDEILDTELSLGLLAAHEYGGHFGYSAERIEDEADHLVGLWFMDHDAR